MRPVNTRLEINAYHAYLFYVFMAQQHRSRCATSHHRYCRCHPSVSRPWGVPFFFWVVVPQQVGQTAESPGYVSPVKLEKNPTRY